MGSVKTPSEARGIFSRLPDDPAYWDSLTTKIADDAAQTLADYGEEGSGWLSLLARYSTVLAIGASAAVLAAFVVLQPDETIDSRSSYVDAYGLAPTDPLAVPFIAEDTPPQMVALIAMRTAGAIE